MGHGGRDDVCARAAHSCVTLASQTAHLEGHARSCVGIDVGSGVGAVYSLAFLPKGTRSVAVVHLMHSVWAISVCLVNAQNAGLLAVPAEANIDAVSQAKLQPFVVITGMQAFIDASAFLLSVNGRATATQDAEATGRRVTRAKGKRS